MLLLWADERVYYPLTVAPYTPAHWFARGKADPAFRTKPQIALDLVTEAVVADCFSGEHAAFRRGLHRREIGYVLALKPSHAWRHPIGTSGSLWAVADAGESGANRWEDGEHPGAWTAVTRSFRDDHTETWWALEVVAGPYGPEHAQRAVVATTDPATLPALSTWYLVTNLPAPQPQPQQISDPVADLAEVVRLYALRNWVEQGYKQVKQALGWAQYQVRSDRAIRRHWQLVCCAFSFCWWAAAGVRTAGQPEEERGTENEDAPCPASCPVAGQGGDEAARIAAPAGLMADRLAERAGMAGTVDGVATVLAGVERSAPAARVAAAA